MAKTRQQRRGLSTVVGAVFMILVMVGAINVMLWTMQQQNRVTETIIEKTNSNFNRLNEDIEISNVRVDGGKLNMTVTNAGGAAATLKTIYVVNETSKEQFRYDLNLVVDGRKSQLNVGQALPLTVKDNTRYSVRLITESGNSVTTSLMPLSTVALPMALYIIPPTFTPGENVTVLYTVTNNLTDSQLAAPIDLKLSYTVDCSPLGSANCNVIRHVQPPSNITTIAKGNTALFKWVFEVQIPDENYIHFNASLANAKQGNYVRENGLSKLIDAAKTSFQSDIVITSTLVQKPEIFAMFPSPFGDSPNKGIWGVAVANPTDQPMEVKKVIVTVYSPRGQAQDTILIDGGGADNCDATPVPPTETDYWTCPVVNMLMWKNMAGFTIAGHSAKTFMAHVNPGGLGGAANLESYSIDVTVFTSMGQFSKSGYSGSIKNSAGSVANVFTSSQLESTNTSYIIGNYTNIKAGTTKVFNATIAELDSSGNRRINSGSRLIVDVPKCFTDVQIISNNGLTISGPIEFSDGSWQIIGTLTNNLSGTGSNIARTIQFSATVTQDLQDQRVYIMYILADGDSDSDLFPIGPIAEVPIQVVP